MELLKYQFCSSINEFIDLQSIMKEEEMADQTNNGNYRTFGIMLAVSFVIMYGVMFLNVVEADHIYLSLTRLYMTILMVAPMALLMLLLMRKMYPNKKLNTIIALSSITAFVLALVFLRNQTFIADTQYMKAMIPHHSSAILTSRYAHIKDPEVKKLSREIIEAQEEEIAQMKALLEKLDK